MFAYLTLTISPGNVVRVPNPAREERFITLPGDVTPEIWAEWAKTES